MCEIRSDCDARRTQRRNDRRLLVALYYVRRSRTLGWRARAPGCSMRSPTQCARSDLIVMLGGPNGGTTAGYWSRFTMSDDLAHWVGELVHQAALCDLQPNVRDPI